MRPFVSSFASAASIFALSGCMAENGLLRQSGGSAALFGQFKAFDGRTSRPVSFDQLLARASDADVVLFGEEHSDIVCNAIEAQLLATLAQQPRPVTLAMEFFEADVQPALDAYLNGRLSEADFRKLTRQKKAYLTSHRPMIEFCRKASIPVIAANAPWRLTRALRLSGQPYDKFLAGLDPADRALLPRTSKMLNGAYKDRYMEAMKDHEMPTSAPSSQPGYAASRPTSKPDHAQQLLNSYRAQSLWDDTMAESIANQRARFSDRRVMLVVGNFHVASKGGTWVKLRQRRPHDRVLTVIYHGKSTTPLTFDADDRAAGDVIIYGIKPPEEPEKPTTSAPTTAPAPTSQPTTAVVR